MLTPECWQALLFCCTGRRPEPEPELGTQPTHSRSLPDCSRVLPLAYTEAAQIEPRLEPYRELIIWREPVRQQALSRLLSFTCDNSKPLADASIRAVTKLLAEPALGASLLRPVEEFALRSMRQVLEWSDSLLVAFQEQKAREKTEWEAKHPPLKLEEPVVSSASETGTR